MKKLFGIFFYFILVRVIFIIATGYDSCQLCSDCWGINLLSEKVLNGNFNFGEGRFIVSPFYQIFIALHKLIFGAYWSNALVFTQVALSGLSGVYFYKLGKMLFSEKAAVISTILFGIFPMTLWWVHTFCTESIFQSTLLISVYFLVKAVKTGKLTDILLSAFLFSVAFLTKSHALLFSPFVAIYLFINLKNNKRILFPIIYGAICLVFTLPFGLYNVQQHDTYVLSSNGIKFFFYTGNSEFGYVTVADVPEMGTERYTEMHKMNYGYFNGSIHDEIMKKPQKIKQDEYLQLAFIWIKENPIKFLKLKLYNLFFFLMPGVSFRHYTLLNWLFSFAVSFPIYVLGYFGLYKSWKENVKTHFFSLGLFLSMLGFSVIFYVQNRFRTITIEPIYLLYSGFVIANYYEKILTYIKRKLLKRTDA